MEPKRIHKLEDDHRELFFDCAFCGKEHSVEMSFDAYRNRYELEMHIQDAAPQLTSAEREQLTSAICPDCQAEVFGSGDEDEDE